MPQNRKMFEITTASMPRYFWMQFDGIIEQIQVILTSTSESRVNEHYHIARSDKARMVYWFKDGTQVSNDDFTGLAKLTEM